MGEEKKRFDKLELPGEALPRPAPSEKEAELARRIQEAELRRDAAYRALKFDLSAWLFALGIVFSIVVGFAAWSFVFNRSGFDDLFVPLFKDLFRPLSRALGGPSR